MNSNSLHLHRHLVPFCALVLFVAGLVTPSAQAAPQLRITAIDAPSAVVGAGITLKGNGFSATGITVRVSGKRAKILKKTTRTLRFAVPKIKAGTHEVVVRRGAKQARISFRVLTPFKGTVTARLDPKNQKSATIGPAGGNIVVKTGDGTRFTLVIPAGALTKDESIRMVPVASFAGFPLTGSRVSGVRLLPDGLTLARSATLIVQGGGGFSAGTLGFSFGRSTGFELAEATKVGQTRAVQLDHFSDHGTAAARAADFANLVQPLINKLGPLSLSQIRAVVELMAIWDTQFADPNQFCFFTACRPPSFCQAQPVCMRLNEKVLSSIELLMATECAVGIQSVKQGQGLGSIRKLMELQASSRLLGATNDPATPCINTIANDLTNLVLGKLSNDPLEHFADQDLLPADFRADLNGNNTVTVFEFALRLAAEVSLLGVQGADLELTAAYEPALTLIRTNGVKKCATDRPEGGRAIREGFDYARHLGLQTVEYLAALDACGVSVVVVPDTIELAPGEQKQFIAELTNVSLQGTGVTWSASTGFISISGVYTAPQTPGTYKVRATSDLNEARFAEATVTVVQQSCAGPLVASVRGPSAAGVQARVVQPGDVVLKTPEDVAALKAAGITEVTGNVTIGGDFAAPTSLVSLTGLEGLTTVGGNLTISFNNELLTIEGLSGLRSLGGGLFVSDNAKLVSLGGLEGLARVTGVVVFGNPAMTTLDGLCGITSSGSAVSVSGNPALTSLTGLSGLATAGALFVSGNNSLTTLTGLEALTIVTGNVDVRGGPLASVAGLRNVQSIGGTLSINSSPAGGTLSSYTLPALGSVGRGISISGDAGPLRTVSLPALTNLPGIGGLSVDRSDVTSVQAPLATVRSIQLRAVDEPLGVTVAGVTDDFTVQSGAPGGAITASTGPVGGVFISLNNRITLDVAVGAVGGTVSFLTNTCVPTAGLRIASAGGNVGITGNVGFSDAAGLAYANSIPGSGLRQASSNSVGTC